MFPPLHDARGAFPGTLRSRYPPKQFAETRGGNRGLTFGLAIRYLGQSLGYAIALGFTAAFGTLMPPVFSGQLDSIAQERSGRVILLGVATCLAGIVLTGLAGTQKDKGTRLVPGPLGGERASSAEFARLR